MICYCNFYFTVNLIRLFSLVLFGRALWKSVFDLYTLSWLNNLFSSFHASLKDF